MRTLKIRTFTVLGIERDASKAEIKKAYHKAALANHPDKVAEDERADAEIRFKSVSQAYEILYDEQTRHLYDENGMAAFDKSSGAGGPAGMDMNDLFEQMFGGGMGGMGGMPGSNGAGNARRTKKGRNEEHEYQITLEELYKGKTVKFASTKNVLCSHCGGSGGKEKAKPKTCETCKGSGNTVRFQQMGPMVTQVAVDCTTCKGAGRFYKDKDRCKKCKGARVTQQKKMLELYIPRGSVEGEKIILAGEADQQPGQEPGDIVFELKEASHDTFARAGSDLLAELNVTLQEALTGFNRTVLKHLDGRGIQLNTTEPKGRILRPEQVLKINGEGMPRKRTDAKGDLYLVVKIEFPKDGWVQDEKMSEQLKALLPKPAPLITTDDTDEVGFEANANIDDFGAGSDDPRGGAEWEDEDDTEDGPQCAQQ